MSSKWIAISTNSPAVVSSSTIGSMPIGAPHWRHLPRSASPADHRHQIERAQAEPARTTSARRCHHRTALWHTIHHHRQERADHQTGHDRTHDQQTKSSSASVALEHAVRRVWPEREVSQPCPFQIRCSRCSSRRPSTQAPPTSTSRWVGRPRHAATACWCRSRTCRCSPPTRSTAWSTRCSTNASSTS